VDIASWLRQMGLEQYEPVFRTRAVDGSVAPGADRRGPKGFRASNWSAIAASCSRSRPCTPRARRAWSGRHATRRRTPASQSFVLRSGGVDGARVLIRSRGSVRDHRAHTTFGSRIALPPPTGSWRSTGDGMLAYLDYPQAREDDAKRAVRGALTRTTAVAQVASPNSAAGADQYRQRPCGCGRPGRQRRDAGANCRHLPNRARSSSPTALAAKSVPVRPRRCREGSFHPTLP
jgi:hypothetical protein